MDKLWQLTFDPSNVNWVVLYPAALALLCAEGATAGRRGRSELAKWDLMFDTRVT